MGRKAALPQIPVRDGKQGVEILPGERNGFGCPAAGPAAVLCAEDPVRRFKQRHLPGQPVAGRVLGGNVERVFQRAVGDGRHRIVLPEGGAAGGSSLKREILRQGGICEACVFVEACKPLVVRLKGIPVDNEVDVAVVGDMVAGAVLHGEVEGEAAARQSFGLGDVPPAPFPQGGDNAGDLLPVGDVRVAFVLAARHGDQLDLPHLGRVEAV